MSSKTRDKLIEAARQLFIRKGVDNTTISDIACASDKGRRTIYTYFKNKRDIYRAVIEQESDKHVGVLREIAASDLAPADKLRKFFDARFRQSPSFGAIPTFKSMLSGDFRPSGHLRERTYQKEETIIFDILDEGIEKEEFDPERCSLLRNFIYRIFISTDLLVLHDEYPQLDANNGNALIEFIIRGIQKT